MNRPYSNEIARAETLKQHIRQEQTKARYSGLEDFKQRHPDEVRDAKKNPPDYTKLKIRVEKEVKAKWKLYDDRRNKYHGN